MVYDAKQSRWPIVRIRGLSCEGEGGLLLNEVDLDVEPGELLALCGPSEAGKTLLLDLIVGRRRPQRGVVEVCGRSPATDEVGALQNIAHVPERDNLPQEWSICELVAYVKPFYPRWNEELAGCLFREFGVDMGDMVGELSPAKRVLGRFAVALATRACLLVLDDAVSRNDPELFNLIMHHVRKAIAQEPGMAAVFTCYNPADARAEASRIAKFEKGGLLWVKDVAQVPLHELRAS